MYIVTAYNKDDVEITIDLEEITSTNPRIAGCDRNGVKGVVLLDFGSDDKPKYVYFISLDVFVEFMFWKYVQDEE